MESDSDEDEDDENEKSVVLDDGGCLVRSQDEEGSSGSVSVSAGQSDGESPGGGSSESNLEEENCNSYKGNLELGEVLGSVNCTADAVCPVELQPASGPCDQGGLDLGEGSGSEDINVGLECSGIVAADADVEGSGSEAINAERRAVDTETESATEPALGICEGTVIQNASISCLGGLLNFKDFSSAAEMEVCYIVIGNYVLIMLLDFLEVLGLCLLLLLNMAFVDSHPIFSIIKLVGPCVID